MTTRFVAGLLTLGCLLSTAAAQLPGPGLTWAGTSGSSTGSFVPSCTNFRVAAVRGETVTLRVWGDHMALYALFAAASGTQCTPFPGIGNALILDQPLLAVSAGLLTLRSPCLSCPPGYQELRFNVPAVPVGAAVAFQAVSYGASRLAFTVAVTGTIL